MVVKQLPQRMFPSALGLPIASRPAIESLPVCEAPGGASCFGDRAPSTHRRPSPGALTQMTFGLDAQARYWPRVRRLVLESFLSSLPGRVALRPIQGLSMAATLVIAMQQFPRPPVGSWATCLAATRVWGYSPNELLESFPVCDSEMEACRDIWP